VPRERGAVKADLLLVNGRILTMAGRDGQALAAADGKVIAVGEEAEVAGLRGPRTRVVDLEGRLALPGFTDSHVHLGSLGLRLSRVDLTSARTLPRTLRRIAARASRTPVGGWITGGGFDKNHWGDAFPSRLDLDAVAPRHPVAVNSRDGHSLWLNSLALKRCGLTRSTPTPPGGVILRDARGRPTGILQERALALVYQCEAFQERRAGREELLVALRHLLRRGVTSAHAMEEIDLFGLLQEARDRGELGPRITIYRHVSVLEEMARAGVRSGFGDEWLRIGGIKLLVDGALGSQTAWLFRPYENASAAGCGVPVLSGPELRAVIARAAGAGLACAVHAIGDRANAEALEALAAPEVRRASSRGRPALPHRIEHAQLLRRRDVPRFARLGVVASMQPCHILGDIEAAERYWGKRSRWAYPLRSLAKTGAILAFGSDAPVETADPIAGVYAAVQRQSRDGRPAKGWYRKEEGISTTAALRGYMLGPARATGEARLKGKLSRGYLADIVVLSEDITRLRGRGLLAPRVDMVFVGGRLRYRRRGA